MGRGRPVGVTDREARFAMWKSEHVPLLYDWVSSRRFSWPSAAVCWGHAISNASASSNRDSRGNPSANTSSLGGNTNNTNNNNSNNARGRYGKDSGKYSYRALYMAERTGPEVLTSKNTLLFFECRLVEEHYSGLRDVASSWSEEAVLSTDQSISTPENWMRKRIVHPCEVNAIRNFAPGKVVTKGDDCDLFIWDFDKQRNRVHTKNETPSVPNAVLKGHKTEGGFALAVSVKSPSTPDGTYGNGYCNGSGVGNGNGNGNTEMRPNDVCVASGGSDGEVLVWNLSDWESKGSKIHRSVHLCDHTNAHRGGIEAVGFNSIDSRLIVSVGRDKNLVLWDVRSPRACTRVAGAHDSDINAVDNFGTDTNLIATGGTDTKVKVWDKRKLTKGDGEPDPKHLFSGHTDQVNTVMWNRSLPGILASGSADSAVMVWDCKKDCDDPLPLHDPRNTLNGLIFNHAGHTNAKNEIVALEWLPAEHDPWCIASLSETGGMGSDLQIWRMSNFIHRDKADVNADLVRYSAGTSGNQTT